MVLVFLALAFLLAFLVESLVEYILGTPMDKIPKLQPYKWLLIYFALLAGVGVTIYYKVDLIFLLVLWMVEQLNIDGLPLLLEPSILGMILSGLAVGRGSNFLHDLVSKFFIKPK